MAKKKAQKISIKTMDEIMKQFETTKTVEWNGLQLAITKTLSLDNMLAFVGGVTRSCFDSETGGYIPEVKDFAIRSSIVNFYTNIALPENLEHQYSMLMMPDLIDTIVDHVNKQQFNAMMCAIDAKLDNMASANVQALTNQFAEVATSMEAMQSQLAELFNGVNPDDIANLTRIIAQDGVLDENKVVKAYVEQTMGADT